MAWPRMALALVVSTLLLACASQKSRQTLGFTGLETLPRQFRGTLTLPDNQTGPAPVVVLVHGTAGVDSRYTFHKPALLEAGIGTFEVDFKTNVFTDGTDRPSFSTFQPWAFGALKALRAHPGVDASRIAIMGFSLGGHLSMLVASQDVKERWLGTDQPGFAAHVCFYPVCQYLEKYFYTGRTTGAPILIMAGELDTWGDGETCPEFVRWLKKFHSGALSLTIYPGVHHGFDRAGSWQGYAPYARNQSAVLRWNAEAAHDSRKRAAAFLRQAFDNQ